jgi:uncharacterized circularly permuted ATP-grasp superfamily protein
MTRQDEQAIVLDNLERMVVKEVRESGGYGMLMGPSSTPALRAEFATRIKANPREYIAQPVVPLYTAGSDWLKKPYVKGMYSNPVTMHPWKYVYIEHDRSKWDLDEPPAKTTN